MTPDMLYEYLEATGFRFKSEIEEKFKDTKQDLLHMHMKYLVEAQGVHKAKIKTPSGHETLYFIPYYPEG